MHYDKRSIIASPSTNFGVEGYLLQAQNALMLSAAELLSLLRKKGIRNAQIGRVLGLPSSRVTELFKGDRRLRLDEAKKLVDEFEIDDSVNPLSEPIARLVVVWTAEQLGRPVRPEDPQVADIALDLAELARFAASPKGRQSVEAFEGFLQGIRLRQERTSAG